jgi:hypothetical protein
MPYVHYITARWNDASLGNLPTGVASHWRVDGMFAGLDSPDLRGCAYRWANAAPASCVIRMTDAAEASAIYKSKIMTPREAELLGADIQRETTE